MKAGDLVKHKLATNPMVVIEAGRRGWLRRHPYVLVAYVGADGSMNKYRATPAELESINPEEYERTR